MTCPVDAGVSIKQQRVETENELADVTILLLYMYHDLGISIEDAVCKKMELNHTKYSVEKAKGTLSCNKQKSPVQRRRGYRPVGSSTPTITKRVSSSAMPTSSGANDPYKALKTTIKAEINEDAWASLNSDTSRPFDKPKTGRIAVKVINQMGDEVMKVFRV